MLMVQSEGSISFVVLVVDSEKRKLSMATTVEQLAEQAMSLPSESRARLADLLVESLEGADLGALEEQWLSEAKRRRNEIRTGAVKTISGDEALKTVRDSLRR